MEAECRSVTVVAARCRGAPHSQGPLRISRQTASLSERDTVAQWIRELVHATDQQVLVHRSWGTVAAVAERKYPVTVVRSDGKHSWFATAPGAEADQPLTPDQVEHVLIDSLTASGPPAWPDWHVLV